MRIETFMTRRVAVALCLVVAAPARGEDSLPQLVRHFVADRKQAEAVERRVDDIVARAAGKDAKAAGFLRARIAANLEEKRAQILPDGRRFALSAGEVERTVAAYEAFKYEAFNGSGVFPKRYFGYFDRRWDTERWERRLRQVVHEAVEIVNALQAARGSRLRLSDAEVAVTFVAEGGAILLREAQAHVNAVHPVLGVGLDDIATGFARRADAVRALDEKLGSGLGALVTWSGGQPALTRLMTFDEALLGTCVMYLYEKELAAAKLKRAEGRDLSALPLDEQFIVASLVYNSGLHFARERVELIRDFKTASYLWRVSEDNARKRWRLALFGPADARPRLLDEGYPEQPTSWSAVYHVLQRYGGWAALRRFTDVFDADGMFRGEP